MTEIKDTERSYTTPFCSRALAVTQINTNTPWHFSMAMSVKKTLLHSYSVGKVWLLHDFALFGSFPTPQ